MVKAAGTAHLFELSKRFQKRKNDEVPKHPIPIWSTHQHSIALGFCWTLEPGWNLACDVRSHTGPGKGASWAQDNARITGFISDPSGAVVPNAQISLTSDATNQTRTTVSNASGSYRFANVGVGTYGLTVVAEGFQKYTKTGIVVNVAQTLEQDATLIVGTQQQIVTVITNCLQVQTETGEVDALINSTQVEQLATNGRNITSLAALGLGVSNTLPPFGGVNALTHRQRHQLRWPCNITHNVYMIDGGEQNDRGCGGCFMNLPSQDAIAQFKTLDSNYKPDYGIGSRRNHSHGAQVRNLEIPRHAIRVQPQYRL